MEKTNTFVRVEQEYLFLLFITAVLTCGLAFLLFYDSFIHRKYYKNTRTLMRILETGSWQTLTRVPSQLYHGDIDMYHLRLNNGEQHEIWVWNGHNRITMGDDLIGLFATDFILKRRHRKLAAMIEKLAVRAPYTT